MRKILNTLKTLKNRAKHDENGHTLLEVVINIALFVAIGSSFVFGTLVIQNARASSVHETKAVISETGIANSLRNDISSAKNTKLNDVDKSLAIAKVDGTCILWTLQTNDKNEVSLVRENSNTASNQKGEIASGLKSGSISLNNERVTIELEYPSGKTFEEKVPLELANSDGGACI